MDLSALWLEKTAAGLGSMYGMIVNEQSERLRWIQFVSEK